MKYKHIFFDLDRTIWDFERNSAETFIQIFETFKLNERGIPSLDNFLEKYYVHNAMLWGLYKKEQLKKEILKTKRFELTLLDFNINDYLLAVEIGNFYLEQTTNKTYLFPNAHKILEYLDKNYKLHIITNGFEEVQFVKLNNSNLRRYFTTIITSEEAEAKKPHKKIFLYSLQKANAKPSESIMIGDDLEVDIIGANNVGIDQVFFNPNKISHNENVTFEINDLIELKNIL